MIGRSASCPSWKPRRTSSSAKAEPPSTTTPSRPPAAAACRPKEALIADYELHNPLGIARTAVHTIPYSSVRNRVAETQVPTLLVAGDREEGFREQRRFAEQTIPDISVARLDAGHAVNIEAAPALFSTSTTSHWKSGERYFLKMPVNVSRL